MTTVREKKEQVLRGPENSTSQEAIPTSGLNCRKEIRGSDPARCINKFENGFPKIFKNLFVCMYIHTYTHIHI